MSGYILHLFHRDEKSKKSPEHNVLGTYKKEFIRKAVVCDVVREKDSLTASKTLNALTTDNYSDRAIYD